MRLNRKNLMRLTTLIMIVITIAVWVYVGVLENQRDQLRNEVEDLYLELEELETLPNKAT